MNNRVLRAWILGLAILVVAHLTVFIGVEAGVASTPLDLLVWCSPAVAAFITAYLAPRKKILLGASMALPAAGFVLVINRAHEAKGHAVDFPGWRGGWILLKVTLEWDLTICVVVAVIAYFLTRNRVIKGTGEAR